MQVQWVLRLLIHLTPKNKRRLCECDGVSIRNVFGHQGEIKMLGKNLPESLLLMPANDERGAVTTSDGVEWKQCIWWVTGKLFLRPGPKAHVCTFASFKFLPISTPLMATQRDAPGRCNPTSRESKPQLCRHIRLTACRKKTSYRLLREWISKQLHQGLDQRISSV